MYLELLSVMRVKIPDFSAISYLAYGKFGIELEHSEQRTNLNLLL